MQAILVLPRLSEHLNLIGGLLVLLGLLCGLLLAWVRVHFGVHRHILVEILLLWLTSMALSYGVTCLLIDIPYGLLFYNAALFVSYTIHRHTRDLNGKAEVEEAIS